MITSSRGEDAGSHLQAVATPDLYLRNAFRVTGLEVTASVKEAKKRIRDREQCQKLGIPRQILQRAYFPVCKEQTIEDIRIAVDQSLANPYRRIVEELFWFWPDSDASSNNEALTYLSNGQLPKAASSWISQLNSFQANIIPLHNLAVLRHLQALELEHEIRMGGCQNLLCPKCHEYFRVVATDSGKIIACPNCLAQLRTPPPPTGRPDAELLSQLWREALDYWSRLWISAPFWAELLLRAQQIDGILGNEAIDQIKSRLPEALLTINVGLAIEYCVQKKEADSIRHAQVVHSSNFSDKYRASAIRHATALMISQIHQQADLAENNAKRNPEMGLQEATGLLEKTRSDLRCFEILNYGTLNLGYAASDAVASAGLNALIKFGQKDHDCGPLVGPAEEILKLAKSESVKQRISDNLEIIHDNVRSKAIETAIKPVVGLCERISAAISRTSEADRRQPYFYYRQFREEVTPLLNDISAKYGELSDEYKEAANTAAYCLRNISVALHNNARDMVAALEAIQWAVRLCKDQKLKESLIKDLKICQEHAHEQGADGLAGLLGSALKQSGITDTIKRKASEATEPVKWVAAIGISIILLIIMSKNCNESSNSSYGSSASSSGISYTYTPSPSSGNSQASSLPSSLGGAQSQANQNRSTGATPGQRASTPGQSSNYYNRPAVPSGTDLATLGRNRLRQEIESGKAKLTQMESQLETMDKQLESYRADAERYKLLDMIDSYNNLVPIYNALLGRKKQLYSEYELLYNEISKKIDRYNAGLY